MDARSSHSNAEVERSGGCASVIAVHGLCTEQSRRDRMPSHARRSHAFASSGPKITAHLDSFQKQTPLTCCRDREKKSVPPPQKKKKTSTQSTISVTNIDWNIQGRGSRHRGTDSTPAFLMSSSHDRRAVCHLRMLLLQAGWPHGLHDQVMCLFSPLCQQAMHVF